MKASWKRFFVWSSIGSLALGATAVLAKKTRKQQVRPLISEKLPDHCQRLTIWTERFEVKGNDHRFSAHDKYFLQLTPFKVWSVLDTSACSDAERKAGTHIYHVTHLRLAEVEEGERFRDYEEILDRFYATVRVFDESGSFTKNSIARGRFLEFRKCNVGGAVNGVETGEVHRSSSRILNYRFEFTQV
jgi:hypothetical protein